MEQWERRILAWFAERRHRSEQEEKEVAEMLKDFWREHDRCRPRLTTIRLVFTIQVHCHHHHHHHHPKGECAMAPVQGPATLTAAGQVAKASVLGFDQNGNPMPDSFVMPKVTFTNDDEAAATLVSNDDGATADITAVADGVADITATVINEKGDELTDTQSVTVNLGPPPPPPTPVLTSIKLVFDVQAPAAGESPAPAGSASTGTEAPAPASNLTPNQKIAAVTAGQSS